MRGEEHKVELCSVFFVCVVFAKVIENVVSQKYREEEKVIP